MDTHIEDVRGELDHLDIAVHNSVEENIELEELVSVINQFLWSLPKKERGILFFCGCKRHSDQSEWIDVNVGRGCFRQKSILYSVITKI